MVSSRSRVLIGALVLAFVAAPQAAHAQFGLGALKKARALADKAKQVKDMKDKADSAKAAFDALTKGTGTAIDGSSYDRFVKASVAEKAALDAKNPQATADAAKTGGFTPEDYSVMKMKIAAYVAARGKNAEIPAGILTSDEVAVLDSKGIQAVAKAMVGQQ